MFYLFLFIYIYSYFIVCIFNSLYRNYSLQESYDGCQHVFYLFALINFIICFWYFMLLNAEYKALLTLMSKYNECHVNVWYNAELNVTFYVYKVQMIFWWKKEGCDSGIRRILNPHDRPGRHYFQLIKLLLKLVRVFGLFRIFVSSL